MHSTLRDSLWNPLPSFAVPTHIFTKDVLALTFSELAVFLIACRTASELGSNCECNLPLKELVQVTGYSENQVATALDGLCEKSLIKRRWEQDREAGRFTQLTYTICNAVGEGLSKTSTNKRGYVGLRRAMFKEKVPYLTLPNSIIGELRRLRGVPLALYIAGVRLCNQAKQREVVVPKNQLKDMAGINDNRTFWAALFALESDEGCNVIGFGISNKKFIGITLLDPQTGKSIDEVESIEAETGERANGRKHEYSSAALLQWVCNNVFYGTSPDTLKPNGVAGGLLGKCPMCNGANAKRRGVPTLDINVEMRKPHNPYGVWYCHSCKVGGSLIKLVMQRSGVGMIPALTQLASLDRQMSREVAQ